MRDVVSELKTQRDKVVRDEILTDLQESGSKFKVVYLEGTSDYEILLALLGKEPASSHAGVIDGVFVRGLHQEDVAGGSGKKAVKQRIKLAQAAAIDGVYGVADRDGADADSISDFGSSPLFIWPAYCIESLLLQALEDYDALAGMRQFAAYVAHNRSGLGEALRDLGLTRHIKPTDPLLDLAGMRVKYREFDLERQVGRLEQLHDEFLQILQNKDTLRAHCWCNGKWLVDIDLANKQQVTPELSLELALNKVRASGGYQPVKDWWQSIVAHDNSN